MRPLILAIVLVACSSQGVEPAPQLDPASTAPTTTLDSTTTEVERAPLSTIAPTTVPDADEPPPGLPVAPGGAEFIDEIEDGTWFAEIEGIEFDGDRVIGVFDYAEFLTGDEGVAAALEDGWITQEEAADGLPNDFYVRNRNPRLRRIPIDIDSDVLVLFCFDGGACGGQTPITVDEWLSLFTGEAELEDLPGAFWIGQGFFPLWIAVEDGEVVAIEEQYIP